jgi:hypothetical protein
MQVGIPASHVVSALHRKAEAPYSPKNDKLNTDMKTLSPFQVKGSLLPPSNIELMENAAIFRLSCPSYRFLCLPYQGSELFLYRRSFPSVLVNTFRDRIVFVFCMTNVYSFYSHTGSAEWRHRWTWYGGLANIQLNNSKNNVLWF